MDTKIEKDKITPKEIESPDIKPDSSEKSKITKADIRIEDICDENLSTLNKIHAILLHCSNLSKKQKLEFCESERYFMKLYLKKIRDQNDGK